jgi:hypothetical protein
MANGLLSELRRIAENSKDIPQESVNRLMLSALAELVVKVEDHTDLESNKHGSFNDAINSMRVVTTDLGKQLQDVSTKLTILTAELSTIRTNPVVTAGSFAKRHPKSALFISILLVVSIVTLLSSRPFLILLLSLAGVPGDAIEQIILLIS